MTDEQFQELVTEAIDKIPKKYFEKLENIAFVVDDEPTDTQREKLKLHCNQTLFGLYEGVPLTKRGSGYNLVLPDKITIFKLPILAVSRDLAELKYNVGKTLWHEVAHYFGLNHADIHARENKRPTNP